MANYLTHSDLTDELGIAQLVSLTDDDQSDIVNVNALDKAIQYAEGVFDSYIRGRYSLPVATTAMVRSICTDLAVYWLYRRRSEDTDGVFAVKKTAFDEAIALLKSINAGKAGLDVPTISENSEFPETPGQILIAENGGSRIFTNENLINY